MTAAKQAWILEGYALFAKEGPKGLKVEVLAKLVNKSKSSFYHYFADVEGFTTALLAYHLDRAAIMAEKEQACTNIIPELLNVILDFKQDLLFHRQLRVHRSNPSFKACYEKINQHIDHSILDIWAELIGLSKQKQLASAFLALITENFFLQLTEETLTYDWLLNYFNELRSMANGLVNI